MADKNVTKKIINKPSEVVNEALQGLILSNSNVQLVAGHRIVIRSDVASVRSRGLVSLISGGGSGHEPAHGGYVGYGGLTAAVAGDVFTSPPAGSILAAIRAVGAGNTGGVLLIVKNYTGDRLHFGMAAERAKQEGIKVDMVIVNEDCALSGATAKRRGLCGIVLIHKIAGAMAEECKSLEEMAEFLRLTVGSMGTMSVSLTPCSIPGEKPSFNLGNDEMELGLGIHGEKGVERVKLLSAKELVQRMIEHMSTEDSSKCGKILLEKGGKIALMVNNLGGTSYIELLIVVKEAVSYLRSQKGVIVERVYAGTFITSLEMAGVSLTLLHLNEERMKYLDSKCSMPGWQSICGNEILRQPLVVQEPTAEIEAGNQEKQKELTNLGRTLYKVFFKIAETLEENEDKLNHLDRLAGDGDCGATLKRAALGIKKALGSVDKCDIPCNSPSQALLVLATIIEDSAGGSSGALYSIFLVAAAEQLKENHTPQNWASALENGIQAIKRYGGAEEGHRTMLDSLCPASVALKKSFELGKQPLECFNDAVKAAENGAKMTANMKAQAGRASYIGSSVLSEPDPGAVAVALWLNAIAAALE